MPIFTVWLEGLVPPWVAEKLRLLGVRPMVGINGALSVRATMTVCGVFVAPEAVMVTGVVYVPACIPAVLTANDMAAGPVPLRILGVSQAALSESDQLNVPAPVLLIVSV